MKSGIYCIEHTDSGKKYIGKSKHINHRLSQHKCDMKKSVRSPDFNRYLWHAAQKYGISAFKFWVVEYLQPDDEILSARELYWMDFYNTCNREYGYNLRRDSSGGMEVHEETRKLISAAVRGENNPNYGNRWTDEMKAAMSADVKRRYAEGLYDKPETKAKRVKAQQEAQARLKADPERFDQMVRKVKEKSQARNKFLQYTREGDFIREWDTKEEILNANPNYKWQNIYAACNGNKPTYMNFIWRMVPKSTTDYPNKVTLKDWYDTDEFHIKKCIQAYKNGVPTLDEATERLRKKDLMHLHDQMVEAYILRYDPENYDRWCEWMSSEWEKNEWERLYGEEGLGLDPERGFRD